MDKEIQLNKYYLTFFYYYVLAILMIGMFIYFLHIDINSGATMAAIITVSSGISSKFVKDNSRAPNKQECRKLVFGCFLIAIFSDLFAFSLVGLYDSGIGFFSEIIEMMLALPRSIVFITAFFVFIFHYFALKFSFGFQAGRFDKNHNKTSK